MIAGNYDNSEALPGSADLADEISGTTKVLTVGQDRQRAQIELEQNPVEHKGDEVDFSDAEAEDDEEAHRLLAPNRSDAAANSSSGASSSNSSRPRSREEKPEAVSWSQLPKKGQLAILTLARLSEPLTQTSLQSYMFYQLKSFPTASGVPPSDGTVARQVGILAASFTFAQFLTAMLWGRLADSEALGRKKVILIGLIGTAIGSLGFGFSRGFVTAVLWRSLGGALNGNIGVMRTMVSEMVRERRFQSRAFLLLPMTFNIGVIVGPLLGGILADPVGTYPGIFGPGSRLGGEKGVGWLTTWPYALPNVVSAVFLTCSALGVVLGLEETLEALRGKPDYGLRLSRWVLKAVFRRKTKQEYSALAEHEGIEDAIELRAAGQIPAKSSRKRLPFRRIWTPNVLFTLVSHGLLALHVGTFNALWFVFLSTPRYTPGSVNNDGSSNTLHLPTDYRPHLPFTFTGGLALPPPAIGTALAILGVIGISLQLLLYPRLSFRLGTIPSFRYSLLLFPLAYVLVPFLAILPSSLPAPSQASGMAIWAGITTVLIVQVLARTFALPSTAILVNNSSPHPSVLGTVHGIAQSVSSATRTVGPLGFAFLYGWGLERGVVGTAWWSMAGVAILGAVAGRWVKEGDGHEIWLEGEREEELEK